MLSYKYTNHENTQKPHSFDRISQINFKLLTSSGKITFSVHMW